MVTSNHVSITGRRRSRTALALFLSLPLASSGCTMDEPDTEAVDVQAAWQEVIAQARDGAGVRWNAEGSAPETIYGEIFAPLTSVSEPGARALLRDHAALWRMDPAELVLQHSPESLLGRHFTFQQTHGGVPVRGASLSLHVRHDGQVVALHNGYVPGIELAGVTPSLPGEDAVAIARAELGKDIEESAPAVSELMVVPAPSPSGARLAYRVVLTTFGPTYEVLIDASTGELLGQPEDINRYLDGTGQVYNVSAIVATQDNSLRDGNDAATAVPASAYMIVTLPGLVGNGYLDGQFASSADTSKRAFSASNTFVYARDNHGFSEAMGYYFIDYAERYIQSLGFTNINNRQQVFSVNRYKQDNSYYSLSSRAITLGLGGVDDAEDAEVILHEYGHSIQDDQVPNFGSSAQGGAMGEGFGDYWAASVGAHFSGGFQDTCVAEWDATSYSSSNPPCLRRVDGTKHYPEDYVGEVHRDGEMWSAALWQIRTALGAARADRVVLQSHFLVPASGTFADGSNALVSAAQSLGYTTTEVDTIRTILQNRGFTVTR